MATDIIIEPEQENDREEVDNNIFYGEKETVEVVNWEEMFKKHQEETSRLDREDKERIERKEKKGEELGTA